MKSVIKRTLRHSDSSSQLTWPSTAGTRGSRTSSRRSFTVTWSKSVTKVTCDPPKPSIDYRKIATDQELFLNDPNSPGSPIFLPDGAYIFNKLVALIKAQYPQFGFQEVITPSIYKRSLWEQSGHWQKYAEDMYAVKGRGTTGGSEGREVEENEEYGLKPMNCPGHCLIFASKLRSYRDLPLRYADHSALHRNEISGALSGLTRVRRFHQDDGHIFCRPVQIGSEIADTLKFIKLIYRVLGLGLYRLALSTRPKENYIGTEEQWDVAEAALRKALEVSDEQWTIQEGEGAFYGPKIDIILKDSYGKEHQTATVQLDFQLPRRFGLTYTAPAPEHEQEGENTTDAKFIEKQGPVTPVMIHRAVLGSVERMMALLIEHHRGKWPLWLNPRPVTICTTSDQPQIVEWARQVRLMLIQNQMREERSFEPALPSLFGPIRINDGAQTVAQKIFRAKKEKTGIIIVIGQEEVDYQCLSVDMRMIPDADEAIRLSNHVRLGLARKDLLHWCKCVEAPSELTKHLLHGVGRAQHAVKEEEKEYFMKAQELVRDSQNRTMDEHDKGRLLLDANSLLQLLTILYQDYR